MLVNCCALSFGAKPTFTKIAASDIVGSNLPFAALCSRAQKISALSPHYPCFTA